MSIRRSGSDVVKHPIPRSCRTEPKTPWGVHAVKIAERAGNARGVGARYRSGGRRRLDASRVFRTGRSQGLVEREGASREETRSTA
jgi:hypothetical protein